MNSTTDKQVLQRVQKLVAPYGGESLSAFDNMKLVVAVIAADGKSGSDDSVNHQASIAYEVTPHREDDSETDGDQSKQAFYCVQWQGLWIHCGLTNDYSASIQLLSHDGKLRPIKQSGLSDNNEHAIGEGTLGIIDIEASCLREVNLAVISLQQIEFMCMEYAHFDHC
ncbi:hypothetical protein [Shewanella violacea]|nr:hypothetical protein [Shewanella violacea]